MERRTFFYVWYKKDDGWPEVKLSTMDDWPPKKEKVLKMMTRYYREFGGA